MLNFLPKLERSVIEMEKEKRGFLLTGENSFAEAYKRAVADFYTVHGYLTALGCKFERAGRFARGSARACRKLDRAFGKAGHERETRRKKSFARR